MADISKVQVGGVEYDIKDATARESIRQLSEENLDLFYSAIIRRKANPKEPLAITTYPGGGDQPTHPKVLYFHNGWNGHKYWMVYAPYPNNNSFQENPCITYSDDGTTWSEEGISNPIIASENDGCWWSDPHLVYIPDTDTVELWVRWCSNGADGMEQGWEGVYRLKSTDGVNWSKKEYLFHVIDTAWASVLSPSVIYEDGKYKIWFCYKRECLKYYESADGTNWQYIKDISVGITPIGSYKVWHFDIIRTDKGYEFVGCYQLNGAFDKNNYIAYSWSADNETYAPAVCVLDNGASGQFDDLELYRPCLVKIGNKYRMYYGAQKNIQIWHIGVVETPNMYLLNELLAETSSVALPEYSGSGDSGETDVVKSFEESGWTVGYINDSGAVEETLDMHHSDLIEIPTSGFAVTTTVTNEANLRISYYGADKNYIGCDRGAGLNQIPDNYTNTHISSIVVDGAVYFVISCNTADKSAVSVVSADEVPDIDKTNATSVYEISNRGSDDAVWVESEGGASASVTGGVWNNNYLALDGVDDYVDLPVTNASKLKIAFRSEQQYGNVIENLGYVIDCRPTATNYLFNGDENECFAGLTFTIDNVSAISLNNGIDAEWHQIAVTFNSNFTGKIRIASKNDGTEYLQCDIGWIVVE